MSKTKKIKKLKKYTFPIFFLSVLSSVSSFAKMNVFEDKEINLSKTHHHMKSEKSHNNLLTEPLDIYKPQAKEILAHIDVLKELKAKAKEEYMNLDSFEKEVYATQSGQHLKAYFPGKTVSEALEGMVHKELKTLKGKIQGQKKRDPSFTEGDPILGMLESNYDKVYLESLAYAKRSIANEIKYGKDHYVLYHAHMPDLGLYYDMLKEIKQILKIESFGTTNIFREMGADYTSIKKLLENYEENLREYSASKGKPLNATGPGSIMGFSEAPDHMIWAKNNMISANVSLFGNVGKLGENTFYYFLNSMSHISNVDFLVERLLKTVMPQATSAEVSQRLTQYKNVFEDHMRKGGGHLLQVFVKKEKIDEMAFASHPYGVPIWIDKKTNHFAMSRGKTTPLAKISADEKRYRLPKVSSYLDMYTKSPHKFSNMFSPVHKKRSPKQEYFYNDAAQVRLLMDPQKLLDNTFVIESTRNRVFNADVKAYQTEVRSLVLEDMSQYITYFQHHKPAQESTHLSHKTPLEKIIQMMNQQEKDKTIPIITTEKSDTL